MASGPGPGGQRIKQEPSPIPMLKPDPDAKPETSGPVSDDDIYEDTGDLDFSNSMQDVWLTRIPKMLWENWSRLEDDEEVQIGSIRVEGGPTDIKRVCASLSMSFSRIGYYSKSENKNNKNNEEKKKKKKKKRKKRSRMEDHTYMSRQKESLGNEAIARNGNPTLGKQYQNKRQP
ncbi:transcription initiation factor iif [Histoplasma capsulatum]|uniref:Transcription initiation factor iif n=1 Tax=Ajellomyces capsulatus TaxID=5037 RepID=A0A8A1MGN1_AJECA|nr:transcription initiation factor iif [Histoplasma capsulatum]